MKYLRWFNAYNLDEDVDYRKIALGVVVDLRFDCKGQCFVVQPLPLFHDKEIKSKSWSFIWKMTTHLRHRLFLQWLRKSGKSSRVAQRFGKSAVKGTLCKLSKNHICAILRFLDIQNLTKNIYTSTYSSHVATFLPFLFCKYLKAAFSPGCRTPPYPVDNWLISICHWFWFIDLDIGLCFVTISWPSTSDHHHNEARHHYLQWWSWWWWSSSSSSLWTLNVFLLG